MDEINIELNEAFLKQLGAFEPVKEKVQQVAEAIAGQAKATAPVDSGDYAASITAQPSNKPGSHAWVVTADDPQGWIEFGSSTHPGHFTLRTSVEALGLKFQLKSR